MKLIHTKKIITINKQINEKTKKMEPYQPRVSIILPGWKEGQVILNCISSLKKQTYLNFNVFMILGGNDPFILKAKKDDWDNLIILDQIEPNKNKALNLALHHPAIAEILIFSDIDCEFPIDFVEKYTRQFENSEKNIIAGRVQPFHRKGNLLERYLIKNEERRILNLPDRGDFLTGANFAVRKKFLDGTIIQFDENIKSSTDAGFIVSMKKINEPIYFDRKNICYSDFNTENIKKFIKQQSRWFKNVLIYSKDFHTLRSFYVNLILAVIGWALLLFLPLSLIISHFLIKIIILDYLFYFLWIGLFSFMWQKRFKDLNRNESKLAIWIKNFFGAAVLVLLYSFIEIIGSLRALISHSKLKSWKK